MTADLVSRLTAAANRFGESYPFDAELQREAAAEIERLRAKLTTEREAAKTSGRMWQEYAKKAEAADERDALRKIVREDYVDSGDEEKKYAARCWICESSWNPNDEEDHKDGCVAAIDAARGKRG